MYVHFRDSINWSELRRSYPPPPQLKVPSFAHALAVKGNSVKEHAPGEAVQCVQNYKLFWLSDLYCLISQPSTFPTLFVFITAVPFKEHLNTRISLFLILS